MTATLFTEAGVRPQILNFVGFGERVVQAELAYRRGAHPAVRETDVVNGVNNLTGQLGGPVWAKTNQAEVKKLRMLLLIKYPRFMASEVPPDSKGRYKALDETMSPLEATYVAVAMVQQKLLNEDFQFTDSEKADPNFRALTLDGKEHLRRSMQMRSAIAQASDMRHAGDLLHSADAFFSDLRMAPISERTEVKK